MKSKAQKSGHLSLKSDADEIDRLLEWLGDFIGSAGLDDISAYTFQIAVVEVFNNCVQHAYGEGASGPIELECRVDDRRCVIDVRDQGVAFDPPVSPQASEGLEESGRGLHIVHASASEVRFERVGAWNHCHLVIERPSTNTPDN